MLWLLPLALASAPDGACTRALVRGPAVLHTLDTTRVARLAPTLATAPAEPIPAGLVFPAPDHTVTVQWAAATGADRCGPEGDGFVLVQAGRAVRVTATRGRRGRPDPRRGAEAFSYVLDEAISALPLPHRDGPLPADHDVVRVDGEHIVVHPRGHAAEGALDGPGEVFVLDPPRRHGPLPPGHALVDVPLEAHALRGAIADVVVELPGPGVWQVAVEPATVEVLPERLTSASATTAAVRLAAPRATTATVRLLPAP